MTVYHTISDQTKVQVLLELAQYAAWAQQEAERVNALPVPLDQANARLVAYDLFRTHAVVGEMLAAAASRLTNATPQFKVREVLAGLATRFYDQARSERNIVDLGERHALTGLVKSTVYEQAGNQMVLLANRLNG